MPVLSIKPEDFSNYTPVMQQYLKARHQLTGKSVLWFRMGDFYEAFFDDADEVARELEITLTGRPENNHPKGRIPMAGVPARAIKPYIQKLLERNYKVYIAEQMADPKTCKGLVPREIVKIFTPGTINDLDMLESYQNNFILALCPDAKQESFGLAYTDISTGEFYVTEIQSKYLDQELARINPAEIIAPSRKAKKEAGQIVAEEQAVVQIETDKYISPFAEMNFDIDLARQNLSSVFEINSVDKLVKESLGPDAQGLALKAAGAIVEYLKETQASEFASNISKGFDVIKTYQVNEYMILDAATRRNLELVKTLGGETQGSFFSVIDRTSSKPGRRRLKAWLEQPLFNLQAIKARQGAVQELFDDQINSPQIVDLLRKTYDIDRLSSRLLSGLISPKEAISLKDSLVVLIQISALMKGFESGLLTSLKMIPQSVLDFIREVEASIKDEPPLTITDGGIFKHGYNQELDEYISLVEDSESWLKRFEEEERAKTGIKNLKVSFNKVHGYFIETSRINESKLPENYVIKQTMVNNVRAITEELKEFEEKITTAESKRNALEHQLYAELRKQLAEKAAMLKQIAHHVAQLDALLSMATLARENNYICPELTEGNDLDIEAGRHPVVEQSLRLGEFVPNDISLGRGKGQEGSGEIMILTGPNMAGKSTFMRQNALIILLAQMGSFVPAAKARIALVDRIFTRIGASDDLASGRSTFMVEMEETATILNGMTERSFIVLDEIGRGTSTYDGVAIAWSIVEHIAKHCKARTIFATHYHELANLENIYPSIKNYQVLVVENKNSKIEFLHKVATGSADKSYGIEVARLAGLPKSVLDRARAINNQLQSTKSKRLGMSKKDIKQQDIKQAIDEDGNVNIDMLPLFSS